VTPTELYALTYRAAVVRNHRFPARQAVAPGIERGELGSEEETDYATTE